MGESSPLAPKVFYETTSHKFQLWLGMRFVRLARKAVHILEIFEILLGKKEIGGPQKILTKLVPRPSLLYFHTS